MIKQVRVLGLERFNELARLVPELLTETLPKASRAGIEPIFDVAYAIAPRDSGDMVGAMHIAEGEAGESQPGGRWGKFIGPATTATVGIAFHPKKGWYWRLVEFGHMVVLRANTQYYSKRKRKMLWNKTKTGQFVGARPFLRPAFDTMADIATAADGKVVGDAMERLAVK